jgi:hypothetical protein
MTRQGVSRHLALLEQANLIATVWHGREKLHYLNPVPIYEITERWISKYARRRLKVLRDLKLALESQAISDGSASQRRKLQSAGGAAKEAQGHGNAGTRLRHGHWQPA